MGMPRAGIVDAGRERRRRVSVALRGGGATPPAAPRTRAACAWFPVRDP